MRRLVAGNWKMNGVRQSLNEIDAIVNALSADELGSFDPRAMICPPATLIAQAAERAHGSSVEIGGQDCSRQDSGAHTGDISAGMLADAGATAVIVGHSERRADHDESNRIVREKAHAAHDAGLNAIICVGETEEERKDGLASKVVAAQLLLSMPGSATAENVVVAYEPVWAIGTGLTPTLADIEEMHAHIGRLLNDNDLAGEDGSSIVLYGGSVKPSNAHEILSVPGVGGALVGGASLKAADFLAIYQAARE